MFAKSSRAACSNILRSSLIIRNKICWARWFSHCEAFWLRALKSCATCFVDQIHYQYYIVLGRINPATSLLLKKLRLRGGYLYQSQQATDEDSFSRTILHKHVKKTEGHTRTNLLLLATPTPFSST